MKDKIQERMLLSLFVSTAKMKLNRPAMVKNGSATLKNHSAPRRKAQANPSCT
jgi:hypothetical protein